jgi:hypothetical protein
VGQTVQSIIDCIETSPVPLRLAQGGEAYRDVRSAFATSLEAHDEFKILNKRHYKTWLSGSVSNQLFF